MAAARSLSAVCKDFEELLRGPRHGHVETLLQSLKELAHKDSAWEGLDEAEVAAVANLLLGQRSLLELVQQCHQEKDPGLVQCRKNALDACARFLQLHGSRAAGFLRRRFEDITAGCLHSFRRDASNQVGAAGLGLLLRLLKVPGCFYDSSTLAPELLRELKVRHSKLSAGQQSVLLRVIATLLCPNTQGPRHPEELIAEFLQRLLSTLERELDKKAPCLETLSGVLEAWDTMLQNHAGIVPSEMLQRLYTVVSVVALTTDAGAGRYAPQRAALHVLEHHASAFRAFIIDEALKGLQTSDAKKDGCSIVSGQVLDSLLKVASAPQADISGVGRGALDAVLRTLSDGLLVQEEDDKVMAASSATAKDAGMKELDIMVTSDASEQARKRSRADAGEDVGVVELPIPREGVLIRTWCTYFLSQVWQVRTADNPAVALRREVITSIRCLGSLAPAVARLDGPGKAMDILEVVLDSLEAASSVGGATHLVAEQSEGAVDIPAPSDRMAAVVPEYVMSLARVVPCTHSWLASSQWARIVAAGVSLLPSFTQAFTKYRPQFAVAFSSLLDALLAAMPAIPKEASKGDRFAVSDAIGSCDGSTAFEAVVAQGVLQTVTQEQTGMQAMWDLVFLQVEADRKAHVEQRLVDGIVSSVLALARQGVENYIRLLQQEERSAKKMADHMSKGRLPGALLSQTGAAPAAWSFAPADGAGGGSQKDSTAETTFSFNLADIYAQAAWSTHFLQQMATFLDRLLCTTPSGAGPGGASADVSARQRMLRPWIDGIILACADLLVIVRNFGQPPLGLFKILRVAFMSLSKEASTPELGESVRTMLPSFLEDLVGVVEAYQGPLALEALEALLMVRREWVDTARWMQVFRRALVEGASNLDLAMRALGGLERWRKDGAKLDWEALIPGIALHLRGLSSEDERNPARGKKSAAERRAQRAALPQDSQSEGRRDFLRRLLGFVGSLGGECHKLVAEPAPEDLQRPAATFSLRVPVSLNGAAVELEPAVFLTHLERLIRHGSRRSARLAAAESLHAMLRFVIGSDSVHTAAASTSSSADVPTDFADALRTPLLPLAIFAASEAEPAISGIFQPLLTQFARWTAHSPPTATMSAFRDALLDCMSDRDNPRVRSTAARHYAALIRFHEERPFGGSAVVAKRLLQSLLAAASHVSPVTQRGALQCLLWCALTWEADERPTAFEAAVSTLPVVVLCLRGGQVDPDSRQTQQLALQLGDRLLSRLCKASVQPVGAVPPLPSLGFLWRGIGSVEESARHFCRDALLRLRSTMETHAPQQLAARNALTLVQSSMQQEIPWDRLKLGGGNGNPTLRATSREQATSIFHAIELITAQLDTSIWLSLPDSGARLLGSFGLDQVMARSRDVASRAMEQSSLLLPWNGDVLDKGSLSKALSSFTPRDRERIMNARVGCLASMVAFAVVSVRQHGLSDKCIHFLITMLFAPGHVLLGHSSRGHQAVCRILQRGAALAVSLRSTTAALLEALLRGWLVHHPDFDLLHAAGLHQGAFQGMMELWPEHQRGDAIAAAQCLSSYVDGLQELQRCVPTSSLWNLMFQRWPGGMTALISTWRRNVGAHAMERRAIASKMIVLAMTRFLLLLVARKADESFGPLGTLPVAGPEGDAFVALLCLSYPPVSAIPKLLEFFAENATIIFNISATWGASRKRELLKWVQEFANYASENAAVAQKAERTATQADGAAANEASEGSESVASMALGPNCGVLTQAMAGAESSVWRPPADGGPGEQLSKLLLALPLWQAWVTSSAASEMLEVAEPAAKKSKHDGGPKKPNASAGRTMDLQHDSACLHQLAGLLQSLAGIDAALDCIATSPSLISFLVGCLRAVLTAERSLPRTKALFTMAIPPLLLRSAERNGGLSGIAPKALDDAVELAQESVRNMVLSYFPLSSHEYMRDTEEYAAYTVLLDGLLRAVELSAPSLRLLPSLYTTLRERRHREEGRLKSFVNRFAKRVTAAGGRNPSRPASQSTASACFGSILDRLMDDKIDDRVEENIRFALMEKIGLPLLFEMIGSEDRCVEAWLAHWPRLLQLADSKVAFGTVLIGDLQTLALKVQALTCVYGAIEVLFAKTPAELLRERIAAKLPPGPGGQQNSPSKDIILTAKHALQRPPGWERLDGSIVRKYHLRVYAALSAAICATQAKQDLFGAFLFKDELWEGLLLEPWESRKLELAALGPNTDFATFVRPAYSFCYLTFASRRRRQRAAGGSNTMGGNATLLGDSLWAATAGFGSMMGGMSIGAGGESLRPTVLQRAAMRGAAATLSQAPAVGAAQRNALAASFARVSQVEAGHEGLDDPVLPPLGGAEGAALRLQAAMLGRRTPNNSADADAQANAAVWQPDWMELDTNLFVDGLTEDGFLALQLVLLRTVDVMAERFYNSATEAEQHTRGSKSLNKYGWIQPLLNVAETAMADFRFRLLVLRLLVLRAEHLRPVLYGQEPRLFRFVVNTLLDARFGAEKSFHYLFRDSIQRLIVPELGTEGVEPGTFSFDCAYDAEKLLHRMQLLAPHNSNFWQRAHVSLVRLFVAHFMSAPNHDGLGFAHSPRCQPDSAIMLRQLCATSASAPVLQQNALRQLAIYLEFGGFNPCPTGRDGAAAAKETQWKAAVIGCVKAKDAHISAYACGVVGLLAKWHPQQAAGLLEECCAQIDSSKDRPDTFRQALCLEQLLLQCPWALCETGTVGGARRRVLTKMLSWLPSANVAVLRPVLAGFMSLCKDTVEQPAQMGMQMQPPGGMLGMDPEVRSGPPPRIDADLLRERQLSARGEFLLTMQSGDVWSRSLLSGDMATQKVAANLARVVAPILDEESLLQCVGLMLEAQTHLQSRQATVDKEHRFHFARDVLAVCVIVCQRRPDIARGEVAEGVLAFLVQAVTREDDEQLRRDCAAYWEAFLSNEAVARLGQLCASFYTAQTEATFMQAALQSLMALARKAPEYRRKLVRAPLADCQFRPMKVAASSWTATGSMSQALTATQTAATWASVFRATMTQSSMRWQPKGRMRPPPPPRFEEGGNKVVGASVAASLSEDAINVNLVAPKRRSATLSAKAGMQSDEQAEVVQTRLLRHSVASAKDAAISSTERQTKAALAAIEQKDEEEGSSEVQLCREYREGDFPDVEVTAEDIVEPLVRASLSDPGLTEELLLELWSGIAASAAASSSGVAGPPATGPLGVTQLFAPDTVTVPTPRVTLGRTISGNMFSGVDADMPPSAVPQAALRTLVERSQGDVTFTHFLHRLLLQCGREFAATLPLAALQRCASASLLSGVQALEELLPGPRGGVELPTAAVDNGRHRMMLSMLHDLYSSLGERPLMAASVAQLTAIKAFSSTASGPALELFHEGQVEVAQERLIAILADGDRPLPEWEARLAYSTRASALEQLMSWDGLRGALADAASIDPVTREVRGLRAELGSSLMYGDATTAGALDRKLNVSQHEESTQVRNRLLLATHAVARDRVEDAKRLVLQGYDIFTVAWPHIPPLAAKAQHELLSSLPLLRGIESFVGAKDDRLVDVLPAGCSGLDMQHDSLLAWADAMLGKIAISSTSGAKQIAAFAYADMARRCRVGNSLKAAGDMMRRCLEAREKPEYEFVAEVIKLKLQQRERPCDALGQLVEKEMAKQSAKADALQYRFLLGEVYVEGWLRNEMRQETVMSVLQATQSVAEEIGTAQQAEAHAKVADFADQALRAAEDPSGSGRGALDKTQFEALAAAMVASVLRILAAGGEAKTAAKVAHDRLPRIFELLALAPSCAAKFQELSRSVPSWCFLRWLPQALAHLSKVPALLEPLGALATAYPQAVVWPLQLSSSAEAAAILRRQSLANAFTPLWLKLEQSGAPISLVRTMTAALDFLTDPEAHFSAELRRVREAVRQSEWTVAAEHWQILSRKCLAPEAKVAGRVQMEFSQRLKQALEEATKKHLAIAATDFDGTRFATMKKPALDQVFLALDAFAKTRAIPPGRTERAEFYSNWLAEFDARASWTGALEDLLEVPGQYDGLACPQPHLHARIMKFAPQVFVMQSKQRPKRLIILGSDEQEHWFLIKGGEDLRLDARIEQLFEAMNGLLAPAGVPGLRIRTVAVVPVLPEMGIIGWARDTSTFKSIVTDMGKVKNLNELVAHRQRIEWAQRFGRDVSGRYKAIYQVARADIEVAFKRFAGALPEEVTLRAYLHRSALGPEAFWHLRQRFAASLAAANIASYILGIGDRHLDNYLLCKRTAEVVPIDFGYSFGIGALLPVPELMPFRLTGFLVSVLQPLSGIHAHGTYREGVITALKCCRQNRGLLLDACAIFVREPLLDWAEQARRKGEEVDFLPRKRLQFLDERLRGIHPATVLGSELQDNMNSWIREFVKNPEIFSAVITGPEDGLRSKLLQRSRESAGEVLSPAEQADCLILQATDPNILGRTWEGWAPEI